MKIVSFYTPNWLYKERALSLMARCEVLGLEHDIQERPDTGHWRTNTALKPRYIRDMLEKHDHVLWLDCDGELYHRPVLCYDQAEDVDIMACPHRTAPAGKPRDWHVGIMSLRSNERTKAFVDAWIDQVEKNAFHEVTDEFAFIQLMQDYPQVKFEALPDNYHVLMIEKNKEKLKEAVWGLGISRDGDKQKTYHSKDRLEYL